MNRRSFLLLACLSSILSGCAAFRIGWMQGGLCSKDAANVDFDYGKNEVMLLGVLTYCRVRAETTYLDAIKDGFKPRPGAVVSGTLEECSHFVPFLQQAGFKIIDIDYDIETYKKELCKRSCMTVEEPCYWNQEFSQQLIDLIDSIREFNKKT